MRGLVRCTVMIALAISLAGCGASKQERAFEYMPDMARGPAYKAYAPNSVTHDGKTLQLPVANTIPRGYKPFHYGPGDDEAQRAGRELHNPYHATPQVLDEGKALFFTYCQVCHGEQGRGDGLISSKIPTPPSYTDKRLMEYPAGRIFHVVTLGTGKMPSYASQLSADERWKIVTYVRTSLQGIKESGDRVIGSSGDHFGSRSLTSVQATSAQATSGQATSAHLSSGSSSGDRRSQ